MDFMFYVSPQDSELILRWNDLFQFLKIFDEKIFLPRDTGLTPRQIELLSRYAFFDNTKRKSNGWRRFSLVEAIAIRIIHEAQKYGLDKHDLEKLSDTLLDDSYAQAEAEKNYIYPLDRKEMINDLRQGYGRSAIVASLLGIPMSLLWSHSQPCESPIYCSEETFTGDFRTKFDSFIKLKLDNIIEDFLLKLAEKENRNFFSLTKLQASYCEKSPWLADKEKEIIKALGKINSKTLLTFKFPNEIIEIYLDPEGGAREARKQELAILRILVGRKYKILNIKSEKLKTDLTIPLRE